MARRQQLVLKITGECLWGTAVQMFSGSESKKPGQNPQIQSFIETSECFVVILSIILCISFSDCNENLFVILLEFWTGFLILNHCETVTHLLFECNLIE